MQPLYKHSPKAFVCNINRHHHKERLLFDHNVSEALQIAYARKAAFNLTRLDWKSPLPRSGLCPQTVRKPSEAQRRRGEIKPSDEISISKTKTRVNSLSKAISLKAPIYKKIHLLGGWAVLCESRKRTIMIDHFHIPAGAAAASRVPINHSPFIFIVFG